MKKFIFLLCMLAIVSCKKENNVTPSSSGSTQQQWNGLYCILHYKVNTNGSWDTIAKECGDIKLLSSYSYVPYPGSDGAMGRQIYNCNQCK